MIWTREKRYAPYANWSQEQLQDLEQQVSTSKWRMNHHIHPKSGLLNDPNGFSYFNGQWHLFYQTYPFGAVHGLKSWVHLTSKDLVHWQDHGLAIEPDSKFDSHGAYTGTALPIDQRLFIMYTGNVRTKDWQRQSYQIGAWMDANNQVTKLEQPLLTNAPKGYTTSIRDPYLIKKDDQYFAIIGAQTDQERGAALVYQSNDLKMWNFVGPLNIPAKKTGYMVECPNLIFVSNRPVFLYCPQGLPKSVFDYKNIYPNLYMIGDQVDLNTAQWSGSTKLHQLDDGFDVYATQAINAPDGRALAISWIGLPEIDYPTDTQNWAHCLSVVKELSLKDDHLYQNPVAEMKSLRKTSYSIDKQTEEINLSKTGSFEIELTIPKDSQLTLSISNQQQHGSLKFFLDADQGTVTVDRQNTGRAFGEKYGQQRKSQVAAHQTLKIRLIIDVSVFECYINDGYSVITGRFFLDDRPDKISLQGQPKQVSGKVWEW